MNVLNIESRIVTWIKKPIVYRFPLAVLGYVIVLIGAARYYRDSPLLAILLASVSAGALILNIVLIVLDEISSQKKSSPTGIEGVLYALYWILVQGGGTHFSNHGLRICVHVPKGQNWIQLVDYVGDSSKHGKGAKANVSKGIVGEAIRSGKMAHNKLRPGRNLNEFLVKTYGYTKEEAQERKYDCKSWIAVPVGEPNDVLAVIFCDSIEPEFFGKANSFRRKVLEAAVLGIAEFVKDR